MKNKLSSMMSLIVSLVCMIISIVLMTFPNGIPMTFAPGPTETVIRYFSYFSPIPYGYANWFPIITAILSIVIIVLLGISFAKSMKKTIIILLCVIILASMLSWIVFNAFSIVGLSVLLLHTVAFIIQLKGNIQVK